MAFKSPKPLSAVSVLLNLLFITGDARSVQLAGRQAPPTQLPDSWNYKGCYTDAVGQRSLRGATFAGNQQSATSCISYCSVRGYSLAGTEYGAECYCGNSIATTGALADSGCSMPCSGDATEACGGPNRLSVYEKKVTADPTGPSVPAGPAGWGSLGCYSDSVGARILNVGGIVQGGPSNMSAQSCTDACRAGEYKYAGTEYGGECWCGNTLANGHTKQDEGCDMPCNGAPTTFCGGGNRINLYEFGAQSPAPVVKKGWQPEGCYTDSVGQRTFTIGMGVDGAMTNAKCRDACRAAGYILAGTEYSGECFCDNTTHNGGGPAPDGTDGCNMLCNGNQTEVCGGSNRLTVFKFYTGDESTTTTPAPTATPTPTPDEPVETPTRTNTATATATGLPEGFKYKGCYVDPAGTRIMGFQQQDSQSMTIASCSNICADLGYSIAGMEYSYQCFCDNVIRMGGQLADNDSDCGMPCAGNAEEKCGGPNRLSIWSSLDEIKVIQKPKPIDKVDEYKYQGCLTDPQDNRVFQWQVVNSTGNTPEWCLAQCKKFGFMVAGLEYGDECYCGDIDGIKNGQPAPETDCSFPCPGDPEAICGAGLRLTWYLWEGDPLYVWDYPTGNAAGRYEFLIGGPVIPLIAQPAINGKISLLEKKGTGPPNSTGAYEFDPSLDDDIFHAFREMNGIKTDIFCAAGLTMPDRAGRQINIGGWSLDSTYGVRIYTPDGAPGVNSTNDWQENVEEVALQLGRWYPSGMVMANGSMLIVGGQSGSNGPPVPSMEILPRAGAVYNAQYLRDTDPFNLYPFLAVLPSGGIFILYYNEARVLNENTLDTVKILPKAPGGMGSDRGGRTYPYEGTQVLLPQHYPYSDPLEVLVCGGAMPNPRWGIDNCISIAPDAEVPEWTIERMPSRRVMSCMATLPDGTFLILNGAEIGEAGFGLAEDPNLNAVLYDANKPKHRRMSVMANTTIPRMYHSEAVVMDDGRVLVSGSDPQDAKFNQEYRLEVFLPPYLLSGAAQPTFTLDDIDWSWDQTYSFTVTSSSGQGIKVSLLGSEASTHGNSMGARILFPKVECNGNSCTVQAPGGPYIAPVGWYRMFVLDGPTPSHATWVRIGGDPAGLGDWPNTPSFQPLPGVGPVAQSARKNTTTNLPLTGLNSTQPAQLI